MKMFDENIEEEDAFTSADNSLVIISDEDEMEVEGIFNEDNNEDMNLPSFDNPNFHNDNGYEQNNGYDNTQEAAYEDNNEWVEQEVPVYNETVDAYENSYLPANPNKKLKILIGNGKPGLGKSTVSLQLVAPYLFMKNGQNKVPLYTFESLSDNNMFSTNILDAVSVEVRENSFDNIMINIFTRDENAIFDIGGGVTTKIVMETLKGSGLIYGIDLFVIPLTDGRHEAIKAKEFYDFVKEHNKGAKIVFVLNKVASNASYDDVCLQYIDFLGDRNLMIDATRGIIEDIAPEDRNLVHLYNDDIIKYSIRQEESVFEIAFKDIERTQQLLREAISNNDLVKQKYLSARINNSAKAKKYYDLSIKPSLENFDRLLGLTGEY